LHSYYIFYIKDSVKKLFSIFEDFYILENLEILEKSATVAPYQFSANKRPLGQRIWKMVIQTAYVYI